MFQQTDILGDEGRTALHSCVRVVISSTPELQLYDVSGAYRKMDECFHRLPHDVSLLPEKKYEYDIRDVKAAVDRLHRDYVHLKYPDRAAFKKAAPSMPDSKIQEIFDEIDRKNQELQSEYNEAIRITEIEHGSGFIVADGFIVTNCHVIEEATMRRDVTVSISNARMQDMQCNLIHSDRIKDLALLYAPRLSLRDLGITPLSISNQELLPGMPVFNFGYPISHTGSTALFVQGCVSGATEYYGGKPNLAILNCPLNHGNSGGPIMCRISDREIAVTGVAAQKHIKNILTTEEAQAIENIRESLRTRSITEYARFFGSSTSSMVHGGPRHTFGSISTEDPRGHAPLDILTLKLYDALETHSQFNLSNAVTSATLIHFIHDCAQAYLGERSTEIIDLAARLSDPGGPRLMR
ncbi:MAG: trypsin-like peptidase domain-containing protein [Gammaproteobacteria bacterium]|nr:trypsin-like peptidase domain-containing protein [Gammaproteobacteria bacterium]